MKTLHIYDLDDTIFFANQDVIVLDANGAEIRRITGEEYKTFEHAEDHNLKMFSWAMLEDSKNFCETLKPNQFVIDKLIKDLESDADVVVLTARTTPDDLGQFRVAFHTSGIDFDGREIIFAGDNNPGDKGWRNKIPEFEKLFQKQYDEIVIYDDNRTNLQVFWETSLDYPFTTVKLNLIDINGEIHKYYIS